MPDAALELRSFSYRYPGATGPALREVDLRIEAGEMVVLSGRSGSGKTSLLRAACGLIPHFHGGDVAGYARICGFDLADHGPGELSGVVGLVAQDPETQVVSATVAAEIELPLSNRGDAPAAIARAVEEVGLALGIERLLERPTATLSGGELQRVALAAAIVARPQLILLDEPTSQLDPVAGDELIGVLRRLNEDWGATVVIAEHRLERCLGVADRVIAFSEGRIGFDGGPREFCEATLDTDPALAPPLASLFSEAGMRPIPVGVKEARRSLARLGFEAPTAVVGEPSEKPSWRRLPRLRRDTGSALTATGVWVELERGGERHRVLRGVSLRIEPGERVVLMGRNGAGKTTLLRTAAGLAEPAAGGVKTPAGIAVVPQNPAWMIARDRVADELPGEAGRRSLELVGLDGAAQADPRDLSGGERQRLAVALAMAGREGDSLPGIVCLDEPTRGLDQARKASLAAWLGELASEGAAVLVATHDVEFAARFADRVVLLGEGVVVADGDPAEVLAGGWYFATQVARALDGAAVTPQSGAALLRAAGVGASDEQGNVG